MIEKRREDEQREHLPAAAGTGTDGLTDRGSLHLAEEELVARTEATRRGGVLIRKKTVEEKRTIEVPVKREEVIIENLSDNPHRPVGVSTREVSPGETIRVPVLEEEVRVEKFPVVVEELVVGKRLREETERISGVVRREVPVLDYRGQLDAQGDTGAFRRAAMPPRPVPVRTPVVMHRQSETSTARLLLGLSTGPLTLTGLLTAGWLYRRWQHARNRPVSRLRRGLGHGSTGIRASLLIGGALMGWLLRGRADSADAEDTDSRWHAVRDMAASRWADRPSRRDLTARLADTAEDARERSGDWLPAGAGLGGLLALGSLIYLLWRAMRGQATRPRYIGTPGVESALGRDRTLSGELPREMAY